MYSGSLYILNKYKTVCFPVQEFDKKNFYISWDVISQKFITFVNFNALFYKCYKSKKRFIVIHLLITNGVGVAHSTMIIIDKKNNTLERFDPMEKYDAFYKSKLLDLALSDYFEKYNFIHKIPENNYLQTFQNRQTLEQTQAIRGDPIGFCVCWSIWYVDLRLSNPDIEIDELYRFAFNAINNNSKSYTSFIRNYSVFLDKIHNKVNNVKKLRDINIDEIKKRYYRKTFT